MSAGHYYYVAIQGRRNLTCVGGGHEDIREAIYAALNRRERGKRADAIKECAWPSGRYRWHASVDVLANEYGCSL